MLRSLYSAISGLQNHQVRMDLIGNNISNVNTVGYKGQRVTFEESFSQLLAGSSRPPGGNGGTNPVQVGLGMAVGSIDTMVSQGNIQSTGQVTDLAIQGESYFAVSDGEGTYYSRNGAFQLDSNGNMVLPTNGMVLQGKIADNTGKFPVGSTIENIKIPFSEQSPANASTDIQYSRNLNADSEAKGTVVYTQQYFAAASTVTADSAMAMVNSKGQDMNIKPGDVLTFSATFPGLTGYQESNFTIDPTSTYSDIMTAFNNFVNVNDGAATITAAGIPNLGALQISGSLGGISGLQVHSNNPESDGRVANAFFFPPTIAAGVNEITDSILYPADATDLLEDVLNRDGRAMGLENGDVISVNATVGVDSVGGSNNITFNPAATTMQDLIDLMKEELRLTNFDGSFQNYDTVTMNGGNTDDNLPDGSLVVRGLAGSDFRIEGLTVSATNSNNDSVRPTLFMSNMSTETFQDARDVGKYDTSITVYDESGATHIVTMTYVHSGTPGEWIWEVSVAGDEIMVSGNKGKLTFGQDGSVASFTFDDNSSRLTLDPNNGAQLMDIDLDVGGPGNFQGITQFESDSTISAIGQDGYGTGSLTDISIDEYGTINGIFSNGTGRSLAQIMLVDFTNPGGLQKVSDSVYTVSSNSGDPVFGAAGEQSSSSIKPGALEGSNVELSREFTDMITTQRGYQANSRVITVSDSMLEELLSLKR
jgi:flagellar hook protein FlgE